MTDPSKTEAPALPAGAVPLPADKAHPEGNWVVLGDYRDWSGKEVKAIQSSVGAGVNGGTALMQMREKAMELLVVNWSLPLPLPAVPAITDRMPGNVLAALLKLVEPARLAALGHEVAPILTKEALEDEASPTTGSSE